MQELEAEQRLAAPSVPLVPGTNAGLEEVTGREGEQEGIGETDGSEEAVLDEMEEEVRSLLDAHARSLALT